MGNKKKRNQTEETMVFNYNGTDLKVKPVIFNILATLATENNKLKALDAERKIKTLEGKVKDRDAKIEKLQSDFKEVREEMQDAKQELRNEKIQKEMDEKGPVAIIGDYFDAVTDLVDGWDKELK
jgi:outer membrane murein-binding lipoprotein Lpp